MNRFWGLEIKHRKAYNFLWQGWQGCFFLPWLSCNLTSSNVHTFCAYVEIHKVRRLVFDTYQRCPMSLISYTIPGMCQACRSLVDQLISFFLVSQMCHYKLQTKTHFLPAKMQLLAFMYTLSCLQKLWRHNFKYETNFG